MEAVIKNLRLNDQQKQAVEYVKRNGRITNSKYQEIIGVTRKTAGRDINGLVELGIFDLLGSNRGAHYVVAKKKRATYGTIWGQRMTQRPRDHAYLVWDIYRTYGT